MVRETGDVLFADADDMLGLVRRDVPLSAAVTNSARFPFISPAGRFLYTEKSGAAPGPGPGSAPGGAAAESWRTVASAWAASGWAWLRRQPCTVAERWAGSDWTGACEPGADLRQVVDGGYFENYGALTALELARKLRALGRGAIFPVVVVVSNDADRPADAEDPDLLACENPRPFPARPVHAQTRSWRQGDPAAHGEMLAPLFGLYATRAAHGLAALHALRRDLCTKQDAGVAAPHGMVHLALPEPRRDPPRGEEEAAPMNWVLNAAARHLILKTGLKSSFNGQQTDLLCEALGFAACPGEPPGPKVAERGAAPAGPQGAR